MVNPTNAVHDFDSYISALTSRIQADLPNWHGLTAKLAGAPVFRPRPWSYFFRYSVLVSDDVTQGILVKIRHTENMPITTAMVHEKMRAEMRDEFNSLVKIETIFAGLANAEHFFSIHPLALYEDLNVLVMEEADIRPIKSYFQARAMWREGKTRQVFETHMERAGQWLRIFHDRVGEVKFSGPLLSTAEYLLTQEQLALLESSNPRPEVRAVKALLAAQSAQWKAAQVPYRTLHEDYNAANVFITTNGKICSFDPHNRPGPIYYDLAKIIIDLETSRSQIFSFGLSVPASRLKTYQSALLKGYFKNEPYNTFALSLFKMLALIDRWNEVEYKYRQTSGRKKLIYMLSMPRTRQHFATLLGEQLAQWQSSIPKGSL